MSNRSVLKQAIKQDENTSIKCLLANKIFERTVQCITKNRISCFNVKLQEEIRVQDLNLECVIYT
jgi:hypothetical protein